MLRPIIWEVEHLKLIDQRKLPNELSYFYCKRFEDICYAINEMIVRGAPALGIVAAFGFVLGLREGKSIDDIATELIKTRPTANSIEKVVMEVDKLLSEGGDIEAFAISFLEKDIERNKKMGNFGSVIIKDGFNVLTHCNAGALATGGYGTALGVLRAAKEANKKFHVYVDETRPVLQGARLTAFELLYDNIDCTVICDNAAGLLMKEGKIDVVITGADRIAANGDVANKIGTYQVAILAKEHNIPFYVAAPLYTFDFSTTSGDLIKIEYRNDLEIKMIYGAYITPKDVRVLNPAFDITPSKLISGYITEEGVYTNLEIRKLKNCLKYNN